jgi:hypothetical protein
MKEFKEGDKVIFTGVDSVMPVGSEGIVLNKVRHIIDIDIYEVLFVNSKSNSPVKCIYYDLELLEDILTPIEKYILEQERNERKA